MVHLKFNFAYKFELGQAHKMCCADDESSINKHVAIPYLNFMFIQNSDIPTKSQSAIAGENFLSLKRNRHIQFFHYFLALSVISFMTDESCSCCDGVFTFHGFEICITAIFYYILFTSNCQISYVIYWIWNLRTHRKFRPKIICFLTFIPDFHLYVK